MAFRRVAYNRSWFMIVLGVIVLFAVSWSWIQLMLNGQASGDDTLESALGASIGLLALARGLTGAWGKRQLGVDVAAGKLVLPDGSVHDLDAIGALTIETRREQVSDMYRRPGSVSVFLLRAARVKYYLFESVSKADTKARFDALEAAVLQSRIRRILERPTGEGAFRSGPDALREIRDVAGDRERALAALRALGKDPDRDIRERAASCLAQPWG